MSLPVFFRRRYWGGVVLSIQQRILCNIARKLASEDFLAYVMEQKKILSIVEHLKVNG